MIDLISKIILFLMGLIILFIIISIPFRYSNKSNINDKIICRNYNMVLFEYNKILYCKSENGTGLITLIPLEQLKGN